jgi:enoyl-CoA hydratase
MALVGYEHDDGVALITLKRPEVGNAQNPALLAELDEAWTSAAGDDGVRVIVVKADGKHFSAGHDLNPIERGAEYGGEEQGIAPAYAWERRVYFGYTRRWRDIPKPSIAAVQGGCVGAGLMLCWPCDLILASDDAFFSDPVIKLGIAGVEYHGHTWEWGPRKAKEMLFTGRRMTAAEAHDLGMVTRVVKREHLHDEALSLAREISQMDPFGLAQIKRAVNHTVDVQGQHVALQAAFDIHWLGHSHALSRTGNRQAIMGDLETMKAAGGGSPARAGSSRPT